MLVFRPVLNAIARNIYEVILCIIPSGDTNTQLVGANDVRRWDEHRICRASEGVQRDAPGGRLADSSEQTPEGRGFINQLALYKITASKCSFLYWLAWLTCPLPPNAENEEKIYFCGGICSKELIAYRKLWESIYYSWSTWAHFGNSFLCDQIDLKLDKNTLVHKHSSIFLYSLWFEAIGY